MGTKFDSMDWGFLGDQFRALSAEFPGTIHDVLTMKKNPDGTIQGPEPDSEYPDFAKLGTVFPYLEGGTETDDGIVSHGLIRTRGQTWDIGLALSKFRMAVVPFSVADWLDHVFTTYRASYQTIDDHSFVPDIFVISEKLSREIVSAKDEPQDGPTAAQSKPSETAANYTITKGPQVWTFRYNGKDSVIPANLKGLKLLEILLRGKPDKDFFPSELLREIRRPNAGIIRTISDGEAMDERLSNGDCVSKDEAEKIRERDKKSVERALRTVFRKIDNRELRNHFEKCIQTGVILSYRPDSAIRWII